MRQLSRELYTDECDDMCRSQQPLGRRLAEGGRGGGGGGGV